MPQPLLKSDVLDIKDLTVGMKLQGTVRNVVDFGLFIDIGLNIHLLKVVSIYIVTTEIISILENIGKMNPNILPSKMKDMFFKLKEW